MTNLNKHDRKVVLAELEVILDYAANAQSKDGIVRYIETRMKQYDKSNKNKKSKVKKDNSLLARVVEYFEDTEWLQEGEVVEEGDLLIDTNCQSISDLRDCIIQINNKNLLKGYSIKWNTDGLATEERDYWLEESDEDDKSKKTKKSKTKPTIQSVESGLYARGDILFKDKLDVDDAADRQCIPKPYTYDDETNGYTKRQLDLVVELNCQLIKILSERKFMVDEYSSEAILRPKELEKILTDFKYVDNDVLEDEE